MTVRLCRTTAMATAMGPVQQACAVAQQHGLVTRAIWVRLLRHSSCRVEWSVEPVGLFMHLVSCKLQPHRLHRSAGCSTDTLHSYAGQSCS